MSENFIKDANFWNAIIILAGLVILVCVIIISFQIYWAKNACKTIGGDYSIKINTLPHKCNGETFVKYKDGWDFERNFVIKDPLF